MVLLPGNWGSNCTLPVLLHNDAILGQLFLDQDDFLLTFYDEIASCKQILCKKKTHNQRRNSLKHLYDAVPGSRGHSLSFASSIGVFPVRTQFELRSMIGILKHMNNKNITVMKWLRNAQFGWQDQYTWWRNSAEERLRHKQTKQVTVQLVEHCGWFSDCHGCTQCQLLWGQNRSCLWDGTDGRKTTQKCYKISVLISNNS